MASSVTPIDRKDVVEKKKVNPRHYDKVGMKDTVTSLEKMSEDLYCMPCNENIEISLEEPTDTVVVEESHIKHHTGYKLISIDMDQQWTDTVINHVKVCSKATFKVIATTKRGFEWVDHYQCTWCKKIFDKESSTIVRNDSFGVNPSHVNLTMATSSFIVGITVSKLYELCLEAGICSPTKKQHVQ